MKNRIRELEFEAEFVNPRFEQAAQELQSQVTALQRFQQKTQEEYLHSMNQANSEKNRAESMSRDLMMKMKDLESEIRTYRDRYSTLICEAQDTIKAHRSNSTTDYLIVNMDNVWHGIRDKNDSRRDIDQKYKKDVDNFDTIAESMRRGPLKKYLTDNEFCSMCSQAQSKKAGWILSTSKMLTTDGANDVANQLIKMLPYDITAVALDGYLVVKNA